MHRARQSRGSSPRTPHKVLFISHHFSRNIRGAIMLHPDGSATPRDKFPFAPAFRQAAFPMANVTCANFVWRDKTNFPGGRHRVLSWPSLDPIRHPSKPARRCARSSEITIGHLTEHNTNKSTAYLEKNSRFFRLAFFPSPDAANS
jgi:hypothetical protein